MATRTPSMPATGLPEDVRGLSEAFVADLEQTLGSRFVGMFQYGAVCFPPSPVSDFDAHVVVADPFTDADREAVTALGQRMLAYPLGDDMDVWYVTLESIRSSDPPQTELRPGYRDDSWALHRAHIHAGRYVLSAGPDPQALVPEPTWPELDEALQGELKYVEDHLADAPAFCVLNLCRILYSYEVGDVVVGKLQAALWALAFLDVDLHRTVRASVDAYLDRTYLAGTDVEPFYRAVARRIQVACRRANPNN